MHKTTFFFFFKSEICLLKITFNFGLDWGRWSMTIDHWSCCWTPAIHDSFSSSSPWPHHAWAICKTKKKHPKHSISRKSLLIHIGVRNYFQPNQILGAFWEMAKNGQEKWPKTHFLELGHQNCDKKYWVGGGPFFKPRISWKAVCIPHYIFVILVVKYTTQEMLMKITDGHVMIQEFLNWLGSTVHKVQDIKLDQITE